MSYLPFRPSGFALALCGLALAPQAIAAISLDRTRVIFDGEAKSVSLSISNQNKQLPYLAQAWLEDDKGNKIQSPLVVLPPLQRVEPGKQSQVKLQALPLAAQLPQDRESLYYFNLREIPPKSHKANTLQIALQTRIKLFYRPPAVQMKANSTAPQVQITLTRNGERYTVNNPTPYFITLVDGGPGKKSSIESFEPVMVAPKSSAALNVTATQLGNTPYLTYVDDYGGRPQLSFTCSGNSCQAHAVKE